MDRMLPEGRHYVGVVHRTAESDYGVFFPEVPGCATAGRDLAEAAAMAREALALHLEGLTKEGTPWPEPLGFAAVQKLPEAEGAFSFLAVPAPEQEP